MPEGMTDGPRLGGVQRGLRAARLAGAATVGMTAIRLVTLGGEYSRPARGAAALHRASRLALRTLGVRLDVRGTPRTGAALVVGNHVSWLDILVLAACTPMRHVAKAEVGGWPAVGAMARRSGALFVRRDSWRELPVMVDGIAAALRRGHKVQVFPEATSRCGGAVSAFRRAAFQAAIDAAVVVQPVTLQYRDAAGEVTAAPAFVGDETLADSARRVLAMTRVTVRVHWLPAIPAIAGTGRRAVDRARLTELAQNAVAADLGQPVIGGRTPAARPGRASSVRQVLPQPGHVVGIAGLRARGLQDRRGGGAADHFADGRQPDSALAEVGVPVGP